ncbi:MAG: Hpt domain-containing protein [Sulfurimonas sp.]|nr:Hpt domain-containing protein [Sulfurimonas sp.]
MLIYNYKKEFLGIDEFDLQSLGLNNLSELLEISSDFSDLFVKTPGFIHNFKHVHWIDFITCADSTEAPKVIIHIRGDNYKCNLKIATAFLTDAPTSQAYLVNLQNLRKLSPHETAGIADDMPRQQTPTLPQSKHFETPTAPIAPPREIEQEKEIIQHEKVLPPIIPAVSYSNEHLDIDLDEAEEVTHAVEAEVFKVPEPVIAQKMEIEEPKVIQTQTKHVEPEPEYAHVHIHEHEYVFDPHVASKELGLPVDLIEEFIQDFVAQAKEFKAELYQSLEATDITNVKILSHKLKGVAANLRVADAFDTLTIVNTSIDFAVIKANLDKFYRIITKLAGETQEPVVAAAEIRSEEDDFVLDFKDEDENDTFYIKDEKNDAKEPFEITIADEEVPDVIEMPELADDDFSPTLQEEISSEHLDIDFDTLDSEELSLEVSKIDTLPEQLGDFKDDEHEDTLELFDSEKEIKPVSLLHAETKADFQLDYKREVIANEIGIDIDSFNELFSDFIDESKDISAEIKNAIENGNKELYRAEAIKLKGMSENMRIKELSAELGTIINSTQASEAMSSIKKIDAILSQIGA